MPVKWQGETIMNQHAQLTAAINSKNIIKVLEGKHEL